MSLPIRPRKLRQILWSMFVGAAIVFGLYAVLLVSSPDSKADADSYIYALEHSGMADFYGPKNQFIILGYQICADWDNGFSYGDIANAIYWRQNFDRTAANVIVGAAIANLCQENYAQY